MRFGRATGGTARATFYELLLELLLQLSNPADSRRLFQASLETEPADYELSSSDDEKRVLTLVAYLLVMQLSPKSKRRRLGTQGQAAGAVRATQLNDARDSLREHLPREHLQQTYRDSISAFSLVDKTNRWGSLVPELHELLASEQTDLILPLVTTLCEAPRILQKAPYQESVYYATDREFRLVGDTQRWPRIIGQSSK